MLSHLAIIMDGNGRWARARGLPRAAGHRQGAEAARGIIEACGKRGIGHLTLYAFSSENWHRPAEEVNDLMNLLRHYIDKEAARLHKEGICIRIIGDLTKLKPDIRERLASLEALTAANSKLRLNIALSYGSREEIASAAARFARDCVEKSSIPELFGEDDFSAYLYTAGTPDPDLLIRTGGERRISNFLLWQCAYAEFYFTPLLWPDFNEEALDAALSDFSARDRRYGRTVPAKTTKAAP